MREGMNIKESQPRKPFEERRSALLYIYVVVGLWAWELFYSLYAGKLWCGEVDGGVYPLDLSANKNLSIGYVGPQLIHSFRTGRD